MRRMLPDVGGKIVLDIGCGVGRLAWALAERDAQVVGVDKSGAMLNRAIAERGRRAVHFVRGPADVLPFSDEAFDIVSASYVLQHILDDKTFRRTLREITRVTRSGGQVLTVDGLADHSFVPNSKVTVVRTIADYEQVFYPALSRIRLERFRCVEDEYTAQLWRRA